MTWVGLYLSKMALVAWASVKSPSLDERKIHSWKSNDQGLIQGRLFDGTNQKRFSNSATLVKHVLDVAQAHIVCGDGETMVLYKNEIMDLRKGTLKNSP